MLLAVLGLLYILYKIPFWFLSATKLGAGRSFVGGLVKAVIAAKTFGPIAGRTGSLGSSGALKAASRVPAGRGGSADPPWPPQPRIAPTPDVVNKRMQESYDAERARAARQSRLPSQEPRFLQPGPQESTHDPAVSPATRGRPTVPEFSSATSPPPPPVSRRRSPRPASAPRFQAPGGPRRTSSEPPPVRPIRVASVPPQLRFQARCNRTAASGNAVHCATDGNGLPAGPARAADRRRTAADTVRNARRVPRPARREARFARR